MSIQLTKTEKVLTKLVDEGVALTEAKARKLGIGNLRAEVSRLRHAGVVIYTNRRVARNGVRVTEYRHGRASRALVAAGYRALREGV